MKNDSLYHTDLEIESIEHKQLYAAEELTFNVTEDILIHMEDHGVSKSDLAGKLGKTKSYISQLLSGSRNITLKTLSDICFALNIKPTINFEETIKTSIESKPLLLKSQPNWQDEVNGCNKFDAFNHTGHTGPKIFHKSNVIIRTNKEFWNKAA